MSAGKGSPRGRAASNRAQAAPPTTTPDPAVPPVTAKTAAEAAVDAAEAAAAPAAAPLDSPPAAPPAEPPVPFEVQHSTDVVVDLTVGLHEGVVDEALNPVDLAEEFDPALATGNVLVLRRTLLETYRMPGTVNGRPRLGHRLLMTAGTSVPWEVANRLVQAQRRERAERVGQLAVGGG